MLPRLKLPPHPAALALLAAAFLLPGLAGHDPWKTHDAVGLGIVHAMATSGELLVPRVAGALWMYDPPLYHWIATAFGLALQPLMEFHTGARLASGALVALAFWLVYRAGRDWAPEDEARRASGTAAMLLVLGAVGLMVHAHEALPELASLTAVAAALAALTQAARRPLAAGAAFGAALALALVASSWMTPVALAAAALAARFACPQWREAPTGRFLAAAAPVGVVLAAIWPLALALKSPQAFTEWRHLALPLPPRPLEGLRFYLTTLSWFTWPAWPLALWTAWSLRRQWREPRLFIPAAATLLALAGLVLWGPTDDVDLIPVLAPLALFAAQGIFTLRRGAAGALDWFGVLVFAFFSAAVWFFWLVLATGLPPPVARNMERIAPGYVAHFSPFAVLFALALAAAWVYLILRTERSPVRSLVRWAAGIVLLWGTAAMLLMPWVDYQRTYRSVALQLRSNIPADAGCIAQKALGVSQAASLDYYAGIRPRAFEPLRPEACRLLLVQGGPKEEEFDVPGPGWTKLAEVGRPGDRVERYRLYRHVQ